MAVVPRGPTEFPLKDLTWGQFQDLVFLLTRSDDARVVPVRAKDHGLDARLPDRAGLTLHGWQAKHYTTTKINWIECQQSVKRAIAFWRPPRITFAFPVDLSGIQQETFRKKLIDAFPYIHIDWWGESEIQRRIRDTDEGKRAATWLFENLSATREDFLRAIAVGGELFDAVDAAKRLGEVQKFMDRDPHFNYTLTSSSPDASPALPPSDALFTVELEVDGRPVKFHASERYPGAAGDVGLGGRLLFSDDEAARKAREALARLHREGGKLELSSGVAAQFEGIPVGLKGLVPEQPIEGAIEISAGRPTHDLVEGTPGLPVLVRSGETEVGMVLGRGEPRDGWDATAVGSAGGLEIFLSFRGDAAPRESQMDWRWRLGEGTGLEQLLAAEVMRAAYRGERVELVTPHDETVVAAGVIDDPQADAEELGELDSICEFLGYVAEIEAWLGVPVQPPAQPSEDDVELVGWLIGRIRKPKYKGTWTRVEFTLSREPPPEDDAWAVALTMPYHGKLFGEWHYLGAELVGLEKGRLEHRTGKEKPGDTVAIVPAGGSGEVEIRFFPPSEAPEKAVTGRKPPDG
jgi:hypothetical protein